VPWQAVSHVPRLDEGDVHVWWASPGDVAPWMCELLDDVERRRHEALRRPADRDRFMVGCALLKRTAAAQTDQDARTIRLVRTCPDCGEPHGKPRLPGSGLGLSLSHSGERVVVAVARGTPVGVDVEQAADSIDPDELAGSVLTEGEAAALAALPAVERRAAFLAYWTRKEAVLKATGEGLRTPLRDVEVGERVVRVAGSGETISVLDLDAGAGHVAALAVLGPPPRRLLQASAAALLGT
jgi:4'-phosphopantetheinyl transferase